VLDRAIVYILLCIEHNSIVSTENYINSRLMGACLYVLTLSGTFRETKCKEKLAALNVCEEASSAINFQSKFCSLPANEYVSEKLRISPSS